MQFQPYRRKKDSSQIHTCHTERYQSGKVKKDGDRIWKRTPMLHEEASRNETLKFDRIFHTLTSWLSNEMDHENNRFLIMTFVADDEDGDADCENCVALLLAIGRNNLLLFSTK
ncbi:hypothetical protein Nmel_003374, partial [Mimus melanotis]